MPEDKCELCGLGSQVVMLWMPGGLTFWIHPTCIVLAVRSFKAHHPELVERGKI